MTETPTAPEAEAPAEVQQTPAPQSPVSPTRDLEALYRSLDEPAPESGTAEQSPTEGEQPPVEEATSENIAGRAEGEPSDDDAEVTAGDDAASDHTPRFRINPKRYTGRQAELEVIRLIDQEGYTLSDAVRLVEKKHGAKVDMTTPAEVSKPGTPPAEETKPAVTAQSLADEIAALEAQAVEAYDMSSPKWDTGRGRQLDKEIAAKQRELDRIEAVKAEATQQQEQTAQQRYEAAESEAVARSIESFPDLADENSAFALKVQEEMKRKDAAGVQYRKDPAWLVDIAAKVGFELGIAPVATSANGTGTAARGEKPAVPAARTPAAPAPAVPKAPVKARPAVPATAPGSASQTAGTQQPGNQLENILQQMRRGNLEAGFAALDEDAVPVG